MTRLSVKNRDGKLLGIIGFTVGNWPELIGDYDPELGRFVNNAMRKGITQSRELYDEKEKKFILVSGPISPSDKNFPLAFRDYLAESGYDITELHPEIEEEIKALLEAIPSEEAEKKELRDRLPSMSYAEQTYVLGELRSILEEKSGD